jgi:hypothetical protein
MSTRPFAIDNVGLWPERIELVKSPEKRRLTRFVLPDDHGDVVDIDPA